MNDYDNQLTPDEEKMLEMINLEQTTIIEIPEDFEIKEIKK